jgi:hypothetical protein
MNGLKMTALLMSSLLGLFALGAVLFTSEASARHQSAVQQPACETHEHRAFDF